MEKVHSKPKIDPNVKCPYCGHVQWATYYIDSQSLICDKCDEEFYIDTMIEIIEVRSYTKDVFEWGKRVMGCEVVKQ